MSGDVFATIHGYVKEYGTYVTLFLAVVAAWYTWAGRWIGWTFALTRTRQIDSLKKQKKRLEHLHDSDREYYGWLLSGVLTVLALLALQLVLGVGSPRRQVLTGFVVASGRYVIGVAAYFTAVKRIGDYRRLQRFDQTIAAIDRTIAKLEAKLAVHERPAGSPVG